MESDLDGTVRRSGRRRAVVVHNLKLARIRAGDRHVLNVFGAGAKPGNRHGLIHTVAVRYAETRPGAAGKQTGLGCAEACGGNILGAECECRRVGAVVCSRLRR